nr:hypothetical protein [Microbacterium sp. SORGH_AS_0862]
MGENSVQRRDGDRAARFPVAGSVAQSARLEGCRQILEAPVAGGVLLERPTNVRCAIRIDLHPTNVCPALLALLVQVAEWCLTRSSAFFQLGRDALLHLARQIVRVVRGHTTHELKIQESLGCLVDVLGHRDQGCLGLFASIVDDVVDLGGAAQAIELVHDDVSDSQLAKIAEHRLELLAVRGGSRLAGVDIDADDLEIVIAGVPLAGLSLIRN